MAKAIRVFLGTDTFGRQVEVAQRADGIYFERHQFDNGSYGMATSKWEEHQADFTTTFVNAYDGSQGTYDKPVMKWGFQELKEFNNSNNEFKFRLPN